MAMPENIAAVCADRFVFRLAYAVCLRLLSLSQGRYDVLHVTEDNPDLDRLDVPRGLHIRLLDIDELVPAGGPTQLYGSATYSRLHLPQIAGEGCKRIVYVDYDVAPVTSPAPLFSLDLGGSGVAAVTDSIAERTLRVAAESAAWGDRLQLLGIASIDSYFNAGCLLIDAERWRRDGLTAAFAEIAGRFGKSLINCDQDILNSHFHGKWAALSPRWNFQEPSLGVGLEDVLSPALLHYYGSPKPWTLPDADLKRGPCAPLAGIYAAAGWPDTLADVLALHSRKASRRERLRARRRRLFGFLPRYRKEARQRWQERAIDMIRLIRRMRHDIAASRYIDVEQGISRIDQEALLRLERRLLSKLGPAAPPPAASTG